MDVFVPSPGRDDNLDSGDHCEPRRRGERKSGGLLKADRDRSSSLMSRAQRLSSPPGRAPFLPLSQDFFATLQFSDVLATLMLQF